MTGPSISPAEQARIDRLRVAELTKLLLEHKARDAEALLSTVTEAEMRGLVTQALAFTAEALRSMAGTNKALDIVRMYKEQQR